MKKIILFFVLFCGPFRIFAEQRAGIDFEYPSFTGDFYVAGKMSFPPGAVLSESNITVKNAETGEEIPSRIERTEEWPDGSLLEVTILFSANTSRKKNYVVSYGTGVGRRRIFKQAAVLPIVTSSIGGTPKTSESMDMDVGEMIIKVDKSPEIRYYWHLFPILMLILFSIYRARKNSRAT